MRGSCGDPEEDDNWAAATIELRGGGNVTGMVEVEEISGENRKLSKAH
jgi:hypothetical protein